METIKTLDEWASAQLIADMPTVHELLQGFSEDPTGDGGIMIVREVMRALAKQVEAAPVLAVDNQKLVDQIADLFGIGSEARKNHDNILVNLKNTIRFADLLHAVECEFFMVPGEPDDEDPEEGPSDECLLNCWGSTTEQYLVAFRGALALLAQRAASVEAKPVATTRHAEAINALLSVATAAYDAMDNSEERANAAGGEDAEYIIQGNDFTALSAAMDEIDKLPDDRTGYTLAGGARASWALRDLFTVPPPQPES